MTSVETFKDAISTLDDDAALALADAAGLDAFEILIDACWLSDDLVQKRSDPERTSQRDAFLTALANHSLARNPEHSASLLQLLATISEIESGYTEILRQTMECEGSRLPPATQFAGALAFTSAWAKRLEQLMLDSVAGQTEVHARQQIELLGNMVDPDSVLYETLKAATGTVMILSYQNGWFDKSGNVVLPSFEPTPSDDDIGQVEAVLQCAAIWNTWERAQLRVRRTKSPFQHTSSDGPQWDELRAHGVSDIVFAGPDGNIEIPDFIANTRLMDRTRQHFVELIAAGPRPKFGDIDKGVPLPPRNRQMTVADLVSFEELHGLDTLNQGYSFDIITDSTTYAGLRIAEWLRGYAVLMEIVNKRQALSGSADCFAITENALNDILTRNGLVSGNARTFIKNVCLCKHRTDIYDRPLIKVKDGSLVLVAPAIRTLILGPVVISAIAGSRAQVERKGQAFEQRMRKALGDAGFEAVGFKASRDGAEYEYDALFVWGDYCFLFECKNRSLSSGVLQLAHHAYMENNSHRNQVRRLANGLLQYPDMLDKHLPSARGKLLVPCVINALPYVLPGGDGGIFFGDYSSLHRFFDEPVVGEKQFGGPNDLALGMTERHYRLWAGDRPTPEELLRHLQCPIQFQMTLSNMSLRPVAHRIFENKALIMADYWRDDIDGNEIKAIAAAYESQWPLQEASYWVKELTRIL